MPDSSSGVPLIYIFILLISAAGVLVTLVGLLYWAVHNANKEVRDDIRELRREMHDGEQRIRDELRGHYSDGHPVRVSGAGDDD